RSAASDSVSSRSNGSATRAGGVTSKRAPVSVAPVGRDLLRSTILPSEPGRLPLERATGRKKLATAEPVADRRAFADERCAQHDFPLADRLGSIPPVEM